MGTPRTRSVEAKLASYRANPAEREALAERLASYEKHDSRRGLRIKTDVASLLPSSASPSRATLRRAGSPGSPSGLGTAHSWSSLDTTSASRSGDPVGGWKEFSVKRVKGEQPPLKFGFESEGARRRDYAERTTTALLGPSEGPAGTGRAVRDSESTQTLLHSPLPRTLRPTGRFARGIHATPLQPRAQSHWQPVTRGPAWTPCRLDPAPVRQPVPTPMAPDAAATASRAQHRAESASSPRRWREAPDSLYTRVLQLRSHGESIPAKLSEKARLQLRDAAAPLTGQQLGRLVGSSQLSASIVNKLSDLDKLALPLELMRTERSVLSTQSRRA